MNKDELLKELQKLKDEDYSNDALFNDGYRTSMMDAIDLVKKLNIDGVSQRTFTVDEIRVELESIDEFKAAKYFFDEYGG